MNKIVDRRWLRFKQELPSILFLSTIAIWGEFSFPNNFMNLEPPWSTAYFVLRSILGVFLVVFLFSSMDELAPNLKLEFIKDTPYASAATSKKISVLAMITGYSVAMLFMWYINFLGRSSVYYVFGYAYFVLLWALLYRAACRVETTS